MNSMNPTEDVSLTSAGCSVIKHKCSISQCQIGGCHTSDQVPVSLKGVLVDFLALSYRNLCGIFARKYTTPSETGSKPKCYS